MNRLTWDIIEEAFSSRVITPGVTRTSDVVWWMRQRVADYGLTTWFQPSVDVQRKGATDATLGHDPIIQKGDVLHCDFRHHRAASQHRHAAHGICPARWRDASCRRGCNAALSTANRLQDIVFTASRPAARGMTCCSRRGSR